MPVTSTPTREARLSIRLMWPFVRTAGSDAEEMAVLAREGIGLAEFANPETRLRHSVSMELLEHAVRRTGDPTLGLRAASQLDPAEFDVIDRAARSCENLREAILLTSRYFHLLNGAAEISLEERGDLATWRWRITDGVPQPPAANDFVIASVVVIGRRYTGIDEPDLELHFMHEEPSYVAEYERILGARARFGMPHNAVVMPRRRLEHSMLLANRGVRVAFELQARTLSERLRGEESVAARVREVALSQIAHGGASMELVARKLAMSVATLRRRLEDEGTSHREILDDVRCEVAQGYLRDRQLAIGEVAFLLGFSHVTGLNKAFKRWMNGLTPAAYRAQQWKSKSKDLLRREPDASAAGGS